MILFDEAMQVYHANPADGSSDIKRMEKSARLYRDGKDGICERETEALLFGIKSHMRLLEPERFAREVALKPEGMKFSTREGMAWRALQDGKLIVDHEDATHLTRMHERMPAEVRAIFARCRKEVTVRTDLDGLPVQCRPDLWDLDGCAKFDLKTIGSIDAIDRAIWSLRYDIGDRWYSRVIERETGKRVRESALIFAEKAPPYRWAIRELDLDYQALGDKAINDALAQISARNKSGCWDDAADLRDVVSPPPWMTDRVPEVTDMQEA